MDERMKRSSPKPKLYKRKKYTWAYVLVVAVLVIVTGYITFVYSPTPFISQWREVWISTAMSTWKHQWLATKLIPKSVVDKVVAEHNKDEEDNGTDRTPPPPGTLDPVDPSPSVPADNPDPGPSITDPIQSDPAPTDEPPVVVPPKEEDIFSRPEVKSFLSRYYQIDKNTLPADFKNWNLDRLKMKDIADLGIKTTAGDPVWAIDTINDILIVQVSGTTIGGLEFNGMLAIVKDSSRVFLGVTNRAGEGRFLLNMAADYKAVLGINANAFADPDGNGRGPIEAAIGFVKSKNKVYKDPYLGENYQLYGFDKDNNLVMGKKLDIDSLRDGSEFKPIIISAGENKVTAKSFSRILNPMTAIAQTSKQETMMLVINGRAHLGSAGCTLKEEAEILMKYDCWSAMAIDGGSSSLMVYDGEPITESSSSTSGNRGRLLPSAWLVSAR